MNMHAPSIEMLHDRINGAPDSALEQMREALALHPEIVVIAEFGINRKIPFHELHSGLQPAPGWAQTVDIIVAPKDPIPADELDDFSLKIAPNIDLTAFDSARDRRERDRATLYYDEVLGSAETVSTSRYVITDPTYREATGATSKYEFQSHRSDPIQRRTWVHVYTDADAARARVAEIQKEYEGWLSGGRSA